ncbi:hypothetical protein D9758_001032 [Tetrapyrgos nigripes]|uniref:AMP-dependent synthetase/ligase domain-containing protein n=1 Tax=Tetrapyrgos nigripes TaxID=182062 RepID=A0A8H5GRJ7_9AGAR|nr:hypothetical protein D9758_001032 [Tetrapyrgos nigripes]
MPTTNDSPLFQPTNVLESPTWRFISRMNEKYSLQLASYSDLYEWSTSAVDLFWDAVWDETGVIGHKGTHVVDKFASNLSENVPWFSDAQLNWAENMLQNKSYTKVALIQAIEPTSNIPDPGLRTLTYGELYTLVANLASALLLNDFKPGDRVASYSSNCIENVAACLATAALGGIWVSAAADFGADGVQERFEQVQPRFIFAVDAVVYNAKIHDHICKLSLLLNGLSSAIPVKPKVILIPTGLQPRNPTKWSNDWVTWDDFVRSGEEAQLGQTKSGEIEWRRVSFNDPLWVLFSSGTTGRPKAIVHRVGGMLLQARKEFAICGDLKPDDVFFYYTTTGWMMWNFLVSGLATGCTLVLYGKSSSMVGNLKPPFKYSLDGSPLRDPAFLWRLVDKLGITIFGTSAKYIDHLSKNYKPREHHSLATLRHIYSTGSPLAPQLFDYVYEHIHPNVLLGSITGGTDICSLFAGMCSALPVYRGEIQCRMLGMAIQAFNANGTPCPPGQPGDLVCTRPFPCMPAGFWPLPGFGTEEAVKVAQEKYRQAYFSEFNGVWYHGDHILITPSKGGNGGGVVMLGRSDGVLNPGGVRFGSAELYDVIDMCFASEIQDSVAVGLSVDNGTDEQVILFVKLPDQQVLSEGLIQRIKSEIRSRRTPRHVPSKIVQVEDIPSTLNGKKVEVLVKKIINGSPLSSVNPATLANPRCLGSYVDIGKTLRELQATA